MIYYTSPEGRRQSFNDEIAWSVGESLDVHRIRCGRADEGDGHQYQRLWYTASHRWVLCCVHPVYGGRTHVHAMSPAAASGWLLRHHYDPKEVVRAAREIHRARRARGGGPGIDPARPVAPGAS